VIDAVSSQATALPASCRPGAGAGVDRLQSPACHEACILAAFRL